MHRRPSLSAFTLIELLVVIAIIAILAVVVVLTLNPAQLLAQSRDANRVSDMATLNSALNLYNVDQAGTASFSLGTSSVTYVSIPDLTATTTAGTNCSGLGGNFATGTTFFDCSASTTFRLVNNQGWIPINFSSISAGTPFGSLPVDPVNSTSSNEYYSYQTNGRTFRIVALPESQKYLSQAGTNPTMFIAGSNPNFYGSWVVVPGNPTFGTSNFYVMKYDAACESIATGVALTTPTDGNGYRDSNSGASNCTSINGLAPASLPNAIPIVDVSQASAAAYCASIGAHLITNNEWQTIAWNVENQGSNWNGGVVGTNYIYSGHNDSQPANILTASSDDNQGYFGETNVGGTQKRTLALSDGAIIWDMAGNIFQWTNDTITGTNEPNAGVGAYNYREFTAITSWGTMTQQTAGPANSTWNSAKGIGQIYSEGATDPGVYGFIRDGGWSGGGVSGVEMLYFITPLAAQPGTGFRCTR